MAVEVQAEVQTIRRGPKRKLTPEKYLDAVRAVHDLDDKLISIKLGCTRKTVNNFRNDPANKETIKEARDIIKDFIAKKRDVEYTRELDNFDVFFNLPIIQKWHDILRDIRKVSPKKTRVYIGGMWYICKHLRRHPSNITAEECAKLNIEMRNLYLVGSKAPYGLSYSRIRESIRSFFMLVRRVSGEHLSIIGITKEALINTGKYAKQRIPMEVRHRFEEMLKDGEVSTDEYLELLYLAKWIYYTGTRITASLEINFTLNEYSLESNIWKIEVTDKGEHKKGRKKWTKYLLGFALDDFKNYFSRRFNIPIEDLEKELPRKVGYIFPNFIDAEKGVKSNKVVKIFKEALIKAGLSYTDFQPTHIWRHTFAQDFLKASSWNYEACAEIGGWDSTETLKRHYGEMGEQPKINILMKSMGLDVPIETYELRW